jgi:hypothetical protein
MAEESNKSILVTHAGLKFGFFRDDRGYGYWACMSSGRSFYGHGLGCIVPRQYWSEIRCSALNQGIDSSLLYYDPPEKPKKSKASKIYSGTKTRNIKKDDGSIKIF